MAIVLSALPRAGLGNKLFVWANGAAFGAVNAIPHYTLFWNHYTHRMLLGAGRRRPTYARALHLANPLLSPRFVAGLAGRRIVEPPVGPHPQADGKVLFLYRDLPHWSAYFEVLKPHRALVRERFAALVRPVATATPVIGIHVRLGDFKALDPSKPFAAQGITRTPFAYFTAIIAALRAMAGWTVPVSIFSDGTDAELAPLLALPQVTRFESPSDPVELAALSRARVIVTSASSTFGLWAAFLSDAIVIHHPDHFHGAVRADADAWEGPWPGEGGDAALAADVAAHLAPAVAGRGSRP